eukprot:snap_masked-scaffold148_size310697-processed-gene-0.3 protein:Tk10297 transcript:snap_masked-scaffold148_size310697-processed-gene-0.3-mRNA-1 annotation:"nuclear receptor"
MDFAMDSIELEALLEEVLSHPEETPVNTFELESFLNSDILNEAPSSRTNGFSGPEEPSTGLSTFQERLTPPYGTRLNDDGTSSLFAFNLDDILPQLTNSLEDHPSNPTSQVVASSLGTVSATDNYSSFTSRLPKSSDTNLVTAVSRTIWPADLAAGLGLNGHMANESSSLSRPPPIPSSSPNEPKLTLNLAAGSYFEVVVEANPSLDAYPKLGTPETSSRSRSPSESISNSYSETSASPSSDPSYTCPICGNPAGKHSYYGAQVCSSCRAFFRRSIQKSAHEEFICRSGQSCRIDSKSWKSCKFCRFQSCLAVGMNPQWVMNQEERGNRNAKRNYLQNLRQKQPMMGAQSRTVLSKPRIDIVVRWTSDEECQIRGLKDLFSDYATKVIANFHSENPRMLQQFVDNLNKGTSINLKEYVFADHFIRSQVVNFYDNLSDFQEIPVSDRRQLFAFNFPLNAHLMEALVYHHPKESRRNIQDFMTRLQTFTDQDESLEEVNQMMSTVILDDNVQDKIDRLHDTHIYSEDSKQKRVELSNAIQQWPKTSPNGLADEVLTTLLGLIIILSPDFLNLKDATRVSQAQTKYSVMLHRYLKAKLPTKAHAKFGQGIELISKLRELTTILCTDLNTRMERP